MSNRQRKRKIRMDGPVRELPLPNIPELPAMVARTVGKAEASQNPLCKAALDKEWQKLADARVWIESDVREWRDVKNEAAKENREIHVGNLHELLVEKKRQRAQSG